MAVYKKRAFNVPIYNMKIFTIHCDTMDEVDEYTKQNYGESADGFDALTLYMTDGENAKTPIDNIITLAFFDKPTAPTIAHETTHIVNLIFNRISYKIDQSNSETQAYLHEYIFDKIYSIYIK